MPNIVVFSDGPEGIAELQSLINQLEEAPEVEPEGYETEELVEDEDLRLIVQIRLPDIKTDFFVAESWGDTDILPDYLDHYRAEFPEQEYRLVAVYDEIVTVDDSVDQQEVIAEDEIDSLKSEVLKLKTELANIYAVANTVTGR